MPMIYVTPSVGARVRMPERQSTVMPEEGAWVPHSVHYEHLIAVKDVIVADPQPAFPNGRAPAHKSAAHKPSASAAQAASTKET